MVCGEVTADVGVQEPVTPSVDAGPITKVDDFRCLGWLKSSDDDFRQSPPGLAGMQLDVVDMDVSYSESGLQTNAIPSHSWDRLALQCRHVDDTCPGEAY